MLEVIKIAVKVEREREEETGAEEWRVSVLAAHRHLFAKELRRNFVSQDSGTVSLELSASRDGV